MYRGFACGGSAWLRIGGHIDKYAFHINEKDSLSQEPLLSTMEDRLNINNVFPAPTYTLLRRVVGPDLDVTGPVDDTLGVCVGNEARRRPRHPGLPPAHWIRMP